MHFDPQYFDEVRNDQARAREQLKRAQAAEAVKPTEQPLPGHLEARGFFEGTPSNKR